MIDRVELKSMAKQQISGNIAILFVCEFIVGLISLGFGIVTAIITEFLPIPYLGSIAGLLVSGPFAVSFAMIYLGLVRGEKPEVGDVIYGFNIFSSAFILNLLIGIFTFLWSLLFIIPGIIKGLSYSMSNYILAENPEMPPQEALNKSKKIMEGHKMDLFVLKLSFLGWGILGIISCGIAFIYVQPYMQATTTNFYNAIKQTGSSVEIEVEA